MELKPFKYIFGHCIAPREYTANRALASWCNAMRNARSLKRQEKPPFYNISEERIARLEGIGFKLRADDFYSAF
jgi:hypothetical protein